MDSNPVFDTIRAQLPRLTRTEARIARYILNNETRIGLETGASLAAATQASEITVSRFLHKLGFRGIRELKERLKTSAQHYGVVNDERFMRLLSGSDSAMLEAESQALRRLANQLARPEWEAMTAMIANADRVFVTGFQTVRGMAEDFARRLGIVRDAVRFIAVYDSGLVEWAPPSDSMAQSRNVLVLVDITPYAREAEKVCRVAQKLNIDMVLVTDEFNNWGYTYTNLVFHADSKTGLFLESTATLNSLLNFIVHAVGEQAPQKTKERIENWLEITKDLDLY